MKYVALVRIFSGHEFVEACIRSIYDAVDKIVCLAPKTSWAGFGENKCISIVQNLKKGFDKEFNKIRIVDTETQDQMNQINEAVEHININFRPDWILFTDTDEVWDQGMVKRAKGQIEPMKIKFDAFKVKVFTYIKSVYYRVYPVEILEPVAFVRGQLKIDEYGNLIRFCEMKRKHILHNIYFHHFSYVRESFDDIIIKLYNSHISENQDHVPFDRWIVDKWDKLPEAMDIHPAIEYEGNWRKIEIIKKADLPEIFNDIDFDIVENERELTGK